MMCDSLPAQEIFTSGGDQNDVCIDKQHGQEERPSDSKLVTQRWLSTFERLGVHSEAWVGWATVHESPVTGFLACMFAGLAAVTLGGCTAMTSRPLRWDHHVPAAVATVSHLMWVFVLWRWGPSVTKLKAYYALALIVLATEMPLSLRLLLGPLDLVPFRNRLAYILLNAICSWCQLFSAQVGAWEPDSPAAPYRNLTAPLISATIRNLRISDAITDTMIIKLMLAQAQEPCFWFGAEGGCLRWTVIAALTAIFSVVDFVTSMYLVMGGAADASIKASERGLRVYRFAHTVSFLCELGILSVTLVNLLSKFEEPAVVMSAAERRNAISITAASFVVTLASFSLTMLGIKRVVRPVTRVGADVRKRISCGSRPATQPGVHGSGHP